MDSHSSGEAGDLAIFSPIHQTQDFFASEPALNHEHSFLDSDNENPPQQQQLPNQVSAEDDEIERRIKQEEEKIQAALRQKAKKEYQQKLKRKQKGKLQLQAFYEQKESENHERRITNIQKEKEFLERNSHQDKLNPWEKVSKNVQLQQGEHPGKAEVSRMRQSILNKKKDEDQSCNE